MRTRSKLVLGALAATVFMAFAVSSASAKRIELSNQTFRAIWTLLAFIGEEAGIRVSCPVTLEGSFHSKTLSKVVNALIGYVTKAFVRGENTACNNTGSATVLGTTLPWHLTYESFTGTLPTITGITVLLVGAAFRVHPNGAPECLAGTTSANPGQGIINAVSNVVQTLKADPTKKIPLGGSFICELAGNSSFEGTAEVFVLNSTTTRVTVRLVQ